LYRTTLSGIETTHSPFEAQGPQRLLFLTYRNYLVITLDSAIEKRVGQAFAAFEARHPKTAPN
jgi:hypothetical protein